MMWVIFRTPPRNNQVFRRIFHSMVLFFLLYHTQVSQKRPCDSRDVSFCHVLRQQRWFSASLASKYDNEDVSQRHTYWYDQEKRPHYYSPAIRDFTCRYNDNGMTIY